MLSADTARGNESGPRLQTRCPAFGGNQERRKGRIAIKKKDCAEFWMDLMNDAYVPMKAKRSPYC